MSSARCRRASAGVGAPPGGPPPVAGHPAVPADPADPIRRTPRHTNRGLLATRIVAVVAGRRIVLIGAGVGWAFTGTLQSNSGTSDAASNAGNGGVISADGLTILLVGSDARTDADGNPLSAEELAQVGTEDDGGGHQHRHDHAGAHPAGRRQGDRGVAAPGHLDLARR